MATIQSNFRVRRNFGKINKIAEIPNLIDIQKTSYDKFLQVDVAPEKRDDIGLHGVFKSVFPIKDFNETSSLEFVSYHLEKPKYDVDECHQRGMTYSAPIKVVVRLVVWDKDEETGAQSIRDVKEQEVYFGEIPLMTDNGTFIINGTERVVVSQLHRSPGVFFDHDKGKSHSSGKLLYNARIIPYRGSWLDFEFDHKDILYVRIDRRRKLPATVLLRALGGVPDTAKKNPIDFRGTAEEILNYYYDVETIRVEGKGKYEKDLNPELLKGQRATRDIKDPKSGEVIVKKNRKFTEGAIKKLVAARMKSLPVEPEEVFTKISAEDVVDDEHRRGAARVQRGGHRGQGRGAAQARTSPSSRSSSSTTSTSCRRCATPSCRTRSPRPTRRSWRSTAGCAPVIRRRWRPPDRSSSTSSSTRSATTSPRSAASS